MSMSARKKISLNGTFAFWQASKKTSLAVLFYEGSRYDYGESEPGRRTSTNGSTATEGYFFDFVTYLQPTIRGYAFFSMANTDDHRLPTKHSRVCREYPKLCAFYGGMAFIPREGRSEEDRAMEPPTGEGLPRLQAVRYLGQPPIGRKWIGLGLSSIFSSVCVV